MPAPEALGDEAAHLCIVQPDVVCAPLGFDITPQAPHRPVLGPEVQGRVRVNRGGLLVVRVRPLSPQPEGGERLVGGVCWGMGIVLFVVGWETVGGFELATRPKASGRYKFFRRPTVPAAAVMASR